jgi:hypothetical protein
MAEIFVSPGVYVRERDFSYYVSSIGDSALGLVGETKKGPAMRPTLISNMGDFRDIFGSLDPNKQVGYAAKSYFKYANQAYIVRVLGGESLRGSNNVVYIKSTGTTGTVLCTLLCSGTPNVVLMDSASGVTTGSSTFHLKIISGATTIYSGMVSLSDPTSPVYVETLFPRDNPVCYSAVALQHVFGTAAASYTVSSASTGITTTVASTDALKVSGFTHARSPMIVGDIADTTSAGVSLFTIHTISDGNAANSDIKVAIENIDAANGTFDLLVRRFSDTNEAPISLERFPKLSMDPTNTNFIARAIGDSEDQTGDYELISKYIYVEVEPTAPATALPWGFNRIAAPLSGATTDTFPEFKMDLTFNSSTSVKRQYLGIDFEGIDSDLLMGGWSSAWDVTAESNKYLKGFHMNSGASSTLYQTGPSGTTAYGKTYGKFLVPLIGGNDGWVYSAKTRDLLDTSVTPSAAITNQFKAALDTLRSTEDVNINLLAVPGVAINSSVGSYAIELAEERADVFYVGDMPNIYTSAAQAAAVTSSLDSNFAATYWPYVKTYDADNSQDVTLPATAQVLEAIAYTDQIAYPWFAPAGLNRGLLTDVSRAQYKLTQDDRETLYENKINPVATFAGQGIAIWGQKTLQTRTTALDRINVRRMMIYVEKVIAGAALYLDFEQNDETTWDRFKGLVQPILDLVKIKRGITDFRVIMDETTNTPDMIERGQMVGQIYIKPTKTAEVILINFNLMAQGAKFEE